MSESSKCKNVKCEQCGYTVLVGPKNGAIFKLGDKLYCYDCILNRALWAAERAGLIERIQNL